MVGGLVMLVVGEIAAVKSLDFDQLTDFQTRAFQCESEVTVQEA